MKLTPALFFLLIFSSASQEKTVPPPFEEKAPVRKLEPAAKDDASAADPFDPEAFDGSTPALILFQVDTSNCLTRS